MGKYEVPHSQYRKFRPEHHGNEHDGYLPGDDMEPAVRVSWEDAKSFARWLNKKNGGIYEFRLPTEAGWEHACLGEADTAMSRTDRRGTTKAPDSNTFHLRNMLGNVWEWCE